jgi:hypothetical protein
MSCECRLADACIQHEPVVAYSAFVEVVALPIRLPVASWNSDANKKWTRGSLP